MELKNLKKQDKAVFAAVMGEMKRQQEGMELIEEGLEKEGLTREQIEILSLFNDRGIQMKAKPIMRMLADLGISQIFSRPRTPNDNPFVESLFATTKGAPEYPGDFRDDIEGYAYFAPYFDYYNNVRRHGEIGYVTPMQRHCGEDKAILALRSDRLAQARRLRLQNNRYVFEDVVVKVEIQDYQHETCLTGNAV